MSKAQSPALLAKSVKDDLNSPDTITSSTLRLLRALLDIDELAQPDSCFQQTHSHEGRPRNGNAPTYRSSSTQNRSRTLKIRDPTKVTIYESQEAFPLLKTRTERLSLATDVFNKSLKTLSSTANLKNYQTTCASVQNASFESLKLKPNKESHTLRECSPNRQALRSPLERQKQRTPEPRPPRYAGITVIAECAQVSLECLRKLDSEGRSGRSTQDYQLERGSLMLLEKMCSLGLGELAMKETNLLKDQLQHSINNGLGAPHCPQKTSKPRRSRSRNLEELLKFDGLPTSSELIEIVISFQRLVLKVSTVQEMKWLHHFSVDVLQRSARYGPYTVIMQSYEQNRICGEKASRCLQSLSQVILVLSDSVERSPEHVASQQGIFGTVFNLRIVALQMLRVSSFLASLPHNFNHQLWALFRKFVLKFSRDNVHAKMQAYERVKVALQQLQKEMVPCELGPPNEEEPPLPFTLIACLAKLAEDCGAYSDALDFYQQCLEKSSDDGLSRTIWRCGIATLHLHTFINHPGAALQASEDALKSLKGQLKGSVRELEELLLQGARLRKAAMAAVLLMERSVGLEPLDVQLSLRRCCFRLAFTLTSFMARYLDGAFHGAGVDQSEMESPNKRLETSKFIAVNTIKDAIRAAGMAIASGTLDWLEVKTALEACQRLANKLDASSEHLKSGAESTETPTIYAKLSNVYWSQYLKQKEITQNPAELLSLLKTSVELLQRRPRSEQQAGFLATKFEMLASIQNALHQPQKAFTSLRNAIDMHIQNPEFMRKADGRSVEPFFTIWTEESPTCLALGKVLIAYARLLMSVNEPDQQGIEFFDDESLAPELRVAFLEKQWQGCLQTRLKNPRLSLVAALTGKILSVYKLLNQPLLQSRFILMLLDYASKHECDQINDIIADELCESTMSELVSGVMHLGSTSSWAIPMLSSARFQLEMHMGHPSPNLAQELIKAWSTLVDESQCFGEIAAGEIFDILCSQVRAVIDFADLRGLRDLKFQSLGLQRSLLKSQRRVDHNALALCQTEIALQYTRTGNTIAAGLEFAAAEKTLKSAPSQPLSWALYYLRHAEYLFEVQNFDGSLKSLRVAQQNYDGAFATSSDAERRPTMTQQRCLCYSSYLLSKLELECGELSNSIMHGRQNVKLTTEIWAALQKSIKSEQPLSVKDSPENSLHTLAEDLSNLNLSRNCVEGTKVTKGIKFWPIFAIHCEALLHISSVSAQCGQYKDAIYYADQAHKVSSGVGCKLTDTISQNLVCAYEINAGNTSRDVMPLIPNNEDLDLERIDTSVVSSRLSLVEALCNVPEKAENFNKLMLVIEDELRLLDVSKDISSYTSSQISEAANDEGIAKKTTHAKTGTRVQSERKQQLDGARNKMKADHETRHRTRSFAGLKLARIKERIRLMRAQSLITMGRREDGLLLLTTSPELSSRGTSVANQKLLLEAQVSLAQILDCLAEDSNHWLLNECTTGFPVFVEPKPSCDISLPSRNVTNRTRGKPCKASSVTSTQNLGSAYAKAMEELQKSIYKVTRSNLGGSGNHLLRQLYRLNSQSLMLASVLLPRTEFAPAAISVQTIAPGCTAMAREQSVILAERALVSRSAMLNWPSSQQGDEQEELLSIECLSSLQTQTLAALPDSWTIVIMSLSPSYKELVVSKLHNGRAPFNLRIPLRRSNSEDTDDGLNYIEAKEELLDIISHANRTAHDSRGQRGKEAKQQWWMEREALDQRLKELLENMENMWLGGFRGILSHQVRYEDLLARFAESLWRSLEKHLPSRRSNKSRTIAKSALHANVVELFTSLGDPNEIDLDDCIADLLYFVVDILQFQGERNAYDEINFDEITIDVTDALKYYHSARRTTNEDTTQETILILDKELMAFPWESLPCLQGQPVSRMPSLSCVKARLDMINLQNPEASALSISRERGTYILNPSSDLVNTELAFGETFASSLPGFSSIINRSPSEEEFEACLRDNELFLYFGHGSGAQYIPGRKIRRLDHCAVAFLMGCSSGKMFECGQFEPYGVPSNYMHAGSPATVGTLWDVTDKDIDRFAMQAFENWGLIPQSQSANAGLTVRGKGKAVKSKSKHRGHALPIPQADGILGRTMALGEAVSKARSSCVLRYLNGAAPVVYGIPVVLK